MITSGLLVWSSPAAAEQPAATCLDSIAESRMTRVAVYAAAAVPDSLPPAIVTTADLVTQIVAERARRMLGADAAQLPVAEPRLTWRDLDRPLHVSAYRDGRLTWRVAADSAGPDRSPQSGAALLARALDTARGAGDAPFFWPEDWTSDSVAFRIVLHRPVVNAAGTVTPIRARAAFAVFSALVPSEEPVVVRRLVPPRYPPTTFAASAVGTGIMQFVVDTAGRVDPSTVRDLWPANRPRLTGSLAAYYESFVDAVRVSLRDARYAPARIGGCAVRQLVQQPFEFKIGR